MIPTLYDRFEYLEHHDQPVWDDIRIGRLRDTLSCVETSSINAEWELVMEYPMLGLHASDIQLMRIIYTTQPFFIYQITKNAAAHTLTVYARHITYLLSYITAWPFSKTECSASQYILTAIAQNSPFRFNVTPEMEEAGGTKDINLLSSGGVPTTNLRDWLLNPSYGVVGVYGGEWTFDTFLCSLGVRKGSTKNITIRYGLDLIDAKQQEALDNVVTHIVPYARVSSAISNTVRVTSYNPVQSQHREYWGTFPDKYGVTVYDYYGQYTYSQSTVEATPHLIIRPPADDSAQTERFALNRWYVGTHHTYALPGADQLPFKRAVPINLMDVYDEKGTLRLVSLIATITTEYGTAVNMTSGYVTDDGSTDQRRTTSVRPSSQKAQASEFEVNYTNLRTLINRYIDSHPVTFPVDITVRSLPEFMNGVKLGDTITVEYPDYGISTQAEIMTMEYDVLREQIVAYTIGKGRTSFAETMLHQDNKIQRLGGLVTARNPLKGT